MASDWSVESGVIIRQHYDRFYITSLRSRHPRNDYLNFYICAQCFEQLSLFIWTVRFIVTGVRVFANHFVRAILPDSQLHKLDAQNTRIIPTQQIDRCEIQAKWFITNAIKLTAKQKRISISILAVILTIIKYNSSLKHV